MKHTIHSEPLKSSQFLWRAKIRVDYETQSIVLEVPVATAPFDSGEEDLAVWIGEDRAELVQSWEDEKVVATFRYLPENQKPVDVGFGNHRIYRCGAAFDYRAVELPDFNRVDLLKISGLEGEKNFSSIIDQKNLPVEN